MKKRTRWASLTLASGLALSLIAPLTQPVITQAAADQITLSKLADVTPAQQAAFVQSAAQEACPIATEYGLYTSVMIAQAILESHYGTSQLALPPNNNLFGIKGDYFGQSVSMPTQEWDKDKQQYVTVVAQFKKYPNLASSFVDNAKKLRNGPTWNATYYSGAWMENTSSYQDATRALTGKYATAPTYGDTLNTLIQRWDLTKYDANVQSTNQVAYVTAQNGAAIYDSYSDNRQTTGSTLAYGSAWRITNIATRLDGQIYYQVSTNQWINANQTSASAPSVVTPMNTVLYITNKNGGPLYTTYDTNRQLTGRTLGYASAWRVTKAAKLANGDVFYQVATNSWLRSQDIAFDKPDTAPAERTAQQYPTNDVLMITKPGSAPIYAGLTNETAGQSLKQGSRWQVYRVAFTSDGTIWYQVSPNRWIAATDGQLASGTATAKQRGIIRTKAAAPVLTSGLALTQRVLPINSRWQYFSKKHAHGVDWYQVSSNEWVAASTVVVE